MADNTKFQRVIVTLKEIESPSGEYYQFDVPWEWGYGYKNDINVLADMDKFYTHPIMMYWAKGAMKPVSMKFKVVVGGTSACWTYPAIQTGEELLIFMEGLHNFWLPPDVGAKFLGGSILQVGPKDSGMGPWFSMRGYLADLQYDWFGPYEQTSGMPMGVDIGVEFMPYFGETAIGQMGGDYRGKLMNGGIQAGGVGANGGGQGASGARALRQRPNYRSTSRYQPHRPFTFDMVSAGERNPFSSKD